MRAPSYVAILLISYAALHLTSMVINHSEPVTVTSDAIDPDLFLKNSSKYYNSAAHNRSMEQLLKAIKAIEKIEQEIDEDSRKIVDFAVTDLKEIYSEMRHDTFDINKLNKASVKALNALTYAELKVTEHFVESQDLNNAKIALDYSMLHIKNALRFSEGVTKEYEIKIYSELDSLIQNKHLSDEELIARIQQMLEELDNEQLYTEENVESHH
ncbi:MAG: hypothetical protein CMB80_31865 [Flammeovirgaceae bacterium]|nr:hypothetical protein [Flammeovirgaceae bacterium]MBE62541.1 hypothetical protein [Flammeovirgaceae bacterium]MBR08994.1 hypothetical protein [Rickettsiales bacterium]